VTTHLTGSIDESGPHARHPCGVVLLVPNASTSLHPGDALPFNQRVRPEMRAAAFRICFAVGAVAFVTRALTAESETAIQRVRATSAAVASVIAQATQRSSTFRGLVEAINKSDGLVYVEEGECRQHVRACLVHAVTIAGPSRVLHIEVDPRRNKVDPSRADPELMGLVGHELQHALEILSNPRLRTNADIVRFYMREGTFSTGTAMETPAAEHAGVVIADEVRRAQKNR
jgi:hypothetical protein